MHASIFGQPSKNPPPLWFVTNGDLTVGPVRTDLLLRGVAHQRIPDDCLVRELRWKTWRPLEQIREISALFRATPRPVELHPASDASEVLLFCLHAAARATSATAAVCHRARGPLGRPTASYAYGTAGHELLGRRLSDLDPSIALAHAGHGTLGEPDRGPVEMAIFDRLGAAALSGVAMFPVHFGDRLIAVVELGRADHPFRREDATVMAQIAEIAAD